MGQLLSRSNSHGENNSLQAAFYTRQVQKSDRINSDCQSRSDQLGSTRTNSDRIKKKKINKKMDSDQLGAIKKIKLNQQNWKFNPFGG